MKSVGSRRRRHPRSAFHDRRRQGMHRRDAPGGIDRDSVFLCRARLLCRNQRSRHRERSAGRPLRRRAPFRSDLDQRGLRHRADRADQGEPSAGRAIALLGLEDRLRPDGAVVSRLLRYAGRRDPPVQHLWPATIGTRRHPDHHQPVGLRQAQDSPRRGQPDPRLLVRDRYRARPDLRPDGTGRTDASARPSISAAASKSRSATPPR